MPEPKVRFKRDDGSSYPEWGTSSFSETFNALNNNTYSRDMLNYDSGDAKNIHYGDILVKFGDICDIQKNNIPYVNEGLAIQKYGYLKDGDIILADTAEDEIVGKAIEIYNIKNDIVISGLHTMACRPVESFASKYLGHYLNSPAFHNQLKPYMQGVKVTSIGRANIAKVGVSFPESLEEQQKIADFLSCVDEIITASEEEVANLEKQKKAVVKKIFSQEVRFKREDGSEFPEWKKRPLGTVVEVYDGTHQTPKYVAEGIKFVSVENISDLYGSNKYITKDAFMKQYKNNTPQKGDVLMTRIGDIGTASLVSSDEQLAYYVSLALLKPFSVIRPNYLVQAIASDFFQSELWIRTLHTAYPKKINKEDIGKCLIQIPCLEEQCLIADFLSDFDEAIAAAKKELELWKELKKGLLQQMFV